MNDDSEQNNPFLVDRDEATENILSVSTDSSTLSSYNSTYTIDYRQNDISDLATNDSMYCKISNGPGYEFRYRDKESVVKLGEQYCPYPSESEQAKLWKKGFYDACFIIFDKEVESSEIISTFDNKIDDDRTFSKQYHDDDESGIEYDAIEDSENDGGENE